MNISLTVHLKQMKKKKINIQEIIFKKSISKLQSF